MGTGSGHPPAAFWAAYLLLALLASLKESPVNTPPAMAATPATAPPAMSTARLARLAESVSEASVDWPAEAEIDVWAGGKPSRRASTRWVPGST